MNSGANMANKIEYEISNGCQRAYMHEKWCFQNLTVARDAIRLNGDNSLGNTANNSLLLLKLYAIAQIVCYCLLSDVLLLKLCAQGSNKIVV